MNVLSMLREPVELEDSVDLPKLPDDCWLCIFDYLHLEEKIECRLISRRWNQLLLKSIRSTKAVHFHPWSIDTYLKFEMPGVRRLIMSGMPLNLYRASQFSRFERLNALELINIEIKPLTLTLLAPRLASLKKLRYIGSPSKEIFGAISVFKNRAVSLELEFPDFARFESSALAALKTPKLESFTFKSSYPNSFILDQCAETILQKSLRSLTLHENVSIRCLAPARHEGIMWDISRICPNLEVLDLSYIRDAPSLSQTIRGVGRLKKLTQLTLTGHGGLGFQPHALTESLEALTNLKSLEIHWSDSRINWFEFRDEMDGSWLGAIARALPQLEFLALSLNRVDEDDFYRLHVLGNLKVLYLIINPLNVHHLRQTTSRRTARGVLSLLFLGNLERFKMDMHTRNTIGDRNLITRFDLIDFGEYMAENEAFHGDCDLLE